MSSSGRKSPHRAHGGHTQHHGHGAHAHNTRRHQRRARHRRKLKTLIVAATALLSPHQPKGKPKVTASATYRLEPSRVAGEQVTVRADPTIYEPMIQEAALKHNVSPDLIRAVMRFESAFQPMAVSRAGAQGLMQLMPELAKELGVRDSFDARENIMAGARYLRELLDQHHGRVDLALASYNAGPGAVARYHDAVPPYKETRQYVKNIEGFMKKNRRTETGKP